VQNLKRYTKGETFNAVKHYLSSQDAYTLHKQRRLRFPRRKTISKGISDLYQADLVDLSALSRYNDKYRYLLTVIDVFSKVSWVVPLKSKNANFVTAAFEKVLTSAPTPAMLQTDLGTEFTNSRFQAMLQRRNIHFYTTDNLDIKAAVVERYNRTLKTKMFKYFSHKNTLRYIDVLQDLVDSYNNTYHRSIGMAPNEVTSKNEGLIRSQLYPEKKYDAKKTKWRFKVGDTVRISTVRHTPFEKGYTNKWTRELFVIESRIPTVPQTYGLRDLAGESIKGKFYAQELQKVDATRDERFVVDRIVKTKRTADGKIWYLVSWLGYPEKFNTLTDDLTWID